jgi:hypothetical protein
MLVGVCMEALEGNLEPWRQIWCICTKKTKTKITTNVKRKLKHEYEKNWNMNIEKQWHETILTWKWFFL